MLGVQKSVPELIADIESTCVLERLAALSRLCNLDPSSVKSVIPLLVDALKSTSLAVRTAVAQALQKAGPAAKNAGPALAIALDDAEESVRTNAALALGAIGPDAKQFSTPLMASMEAGNPGAAHALIRLGPDQSLVPSLIQALCSKDGHLRMRAAFILEAAGPTAHFSIPFLVEALNDEDSRVRVNAACALVSIRSSAAFPAISVLIQAVRREINDQIDDEGFIVETRSGMRARATSALGKLGNISPEVIPTLIEAMGDDKRDVRARAASSLAIIGPAAKEAVPTLSLGLHDSDEFALIQYGPWEHPAYPLEGLVRLYSAWALIRIHRSYAPLVIPTLTSALKSCQRFVRNFAVLTLAQIGPLARETAPRIILKRHKLEMTEDVFFAILGSITNDPKWKDEDLNLFAPHFLTSLMQPDHLAVLPQMRFFRKIMLRRLRTLHLGGRPQDHFEEASQAFFGLALKQNVQDFGRRPDDYNKLPGVVRNLANEAVRSLKKGLMDKQGKICLSTKLDLQLELSPSSSQQLEPIEAWQSAALKELVGRFQAIVFGKMSEENQRLIVEHFMNGVTVRQLEVVFGKPWTGLRRRLDKATNDLLMALKLPNRESLKYLAEYVANELIVANVHRSIPI